MNVLAIEILKITIPIYALTSILVFVFLKSNILQTNIIFNIVKSDGLMFLFLAFLLKIIIDVFTTYIRSTKSDPFTFPHIVTAIFTLVFILLGNYINYSDGAAFGFSASIVFIYFPLVCNIFYKFNKKKII